MESHVIAATVGSQLAVVDPRLRGGDEGSDFVPVGAMQAYEDWE
jgi:hypothetical protein